MSEPRKARKLAFHEIAMIEDLDDEVLFVFDTDYSSLFAQLEAAKSEVEELKDANAKLKDAFRILREGADSFKLAHKICNEAGNDLIKQLSAEKAKSAKRRRLASDILCELTSYSQGRYIDGKEIEIKHESDYEFYPNHVDKETILEFKKALLETDVEALEAEVQG